MVCVVGRMRDLILQLSKSSIYSTKPLGDGKIIHLARCQKSGVTKTWFYRISKSKYCFENRCI
ncbi:hypothetical protein DCI69_16330 [Salmonella enterica subsp. enterica serovar Kentucky]|nr:hypothetical protein [Salmonella enterica subsp. enterica serovar Kentucky]